MSYTCWILSYITPQIIQCHDCMDSSSPHVFIWFRCTGIWKSLEFVTYFVYCFISPVDLPFQKLLLWQTYYTNWTTLQFLCVEFCCNVIMSVLATRKSTNKKKFCLDFIFSEKRLFSNCYSFEVFIKLLIGRKGNVQYNGSSWINTSSIC